MSKWIAEFELEDGDTMPEHMDLNYMGAKIDFHCRPMWISVSERLPEIEDVLDKIRAEIEAKIAEPQYQHEEEDWIVGLIMAETIIDRYKAEMEKEK